MLAVPDATVPVLSRLPAESFNNNLGMLSAVVSVVALPLKLKLYTEPAAKVTLNQSISLLISISPLVELPIFTIPEVEASLSKSSKDVLVVSVVVELVVAKVVVDDVEEDVGVKVNCVDDVVGIVYVAVVTAAAPDAFACFALKFSATVYGNTDSKALACVSQSPAKRTPMLATLGTEMVMFKAVLKWLSKVVCVSLLILLWLYNAISALGAKCALICCSVAVKS